MIQKIIKVGTSGAVVIPKKSLEEIGFAIGDRVSVTIDEIKQSVTISHTKEKMNEVAEWSDSFIKRYKKALDALSDK